MEASRYSSKRWQESQDIGRREQFPIYSGVHDVAWGGQDDKIAPFVWLVVGETYCQRTGLSAKRPVTIIDNYIRQILTHFL